jgi:hypothetical protein
MPNVKLHSKQDQATGSDIIQAFLHGLDKHNLEVSKHEGKETVSAYSIFGSKMASFRDILQK